jgi:hypothetical protein|tara:strand:- start:2281 stop:3702 length:1422 start_codon:yes stop_codon:yes gene_type:complete
MKPKNTFCNNTRRDFLQTVGGAFPGLALTGMLAQDGYSNPLTPKSKMIPGKAKSVIFLFMYGGPSHVDTFDYKPKLYELNDKTIDVKTFGRGGKKNKGRVVGPKWNFKPYGQSGKMVSDLFPHVGSMVDDISFIHSMEADSPIHGSAMLMMNSGSLISGKPSLGSWVNYGLGSFNESLPGYVVMLDKTGGPISGAKNWTSGYMPASYAGTVFRSEGDPILNLKNPYGISRGEQRTIIDSLNHLNGLHLKDRKDNTDLSSRISSYELAFKMQTEAPEAIDVDKEPEHIKELYGLNDSRTEEFARKLILSRRLVERGVRFIQVYSGGAHNDSNWDAHGDLKKNHDYHAGRTDKPIAGLLKDLKQRGLLDETIVVWGGEFGRQPTAEYAKGTGRDHNSMGFTMWMAGGGIKGGTSVGSTDELGSAAVEKPLLVKNLHATILTQLGLDPNNLSFFFNGLDEKLVGVEGAEAINEIIA